MNENIKIAFFLLFYSLFTFFQLKPPLDKGGIAKSSRHKSVWKDTFITQNDICGIFLSTSSAGLDTLILIKDIDIRAPNTGTSHYQGDGFFFLITRDSLDRQVIFHGGWDFDPCFHLGSDCGYIHLDAEGLGWWNCKVSVHLSLPADTILYPNEIIRTSTIDTVFKSFYYRKEFLHNSVGNPYMFQRKYLTLAEAKK